MALQTRTLRIALIGLVVLAATATGCSDEDTRQACPAEGLGKVAASGTPCNEVTDIDSADYEDCTAQMEDFRDYKCAEPQVCPDFGSNNRLMMYPYVIDPSNPGEPITFVLTNCSTGNQDLVIEKVELAGDSRCNFVFDAEKDVEAMVIESGNSTIIQTVYKPKDVGEDHAALRIHTNAQNFPLLVLPICGRAVSAPTPSPDGGAASADGGTAPDPSSRCKDVGETIAACHQS